MHDVKESSSTFTREEYEEAVRRCKEYILAGDVFQVVPSQRIGVRVDADPFDMYRILRTVNPSPYMFYLAINGAQVVPSFSNPGACRCLRAPWKCYRPT